MSRSQSLSIAIRKLLQLAMPTEADFRAFLIDYFPDLQRRIASTADRLAQENILLQCVDHESLLHLLRDCYPYYAATNEAGVPAEHIHKSLPAHFSGYYSNYTKSPQGYIRIKWGKQVIFIRPSLYPDTESLMNSLFMSYLSNDFRPYSYGAEWLMYRYDFTDELGNFEEPPNRLAVPFEWIINRRLAVTWPTLGDVTSFFPTENASYSILDLKRDPLKNFRIIGITGDDYERLIHPINRPFGGKYFFRLINHKNCRPRIGSTKTITATDIPRHTHQLLYIVGEGAAENLAMNIKRRLLRDEFIILEQIGPLDSKA